MLFRFAPQLLAGAGTAPLSLGRSLIDQDGLGDKGEADRRPSIHSEAAKEEDESDTKSNNCEK